MKTLGRGSRRVDSKRSLWADLAQNLAVATVLAGALSTGCDGGQTGESGAPAIDACATEYSPVSTTTRLPNGQSIDEWLAANTGERTVPLYWLTRTACDLEPSNQRERELCEYPSPSEADGVSELTLDLRSLDEARRTTCARPGVDAGGVPQSPALSDPLSVRVAGRLTSRDRKIDSQFETWIGLNVSSADDDSDASGLLVTEGSDFRTRVEVYTAGIRGFVESVTDRSQQGRFPSPAWQACSSQPLISDVATPVAADRVLQPLQGISLRSANAFAGRVLQFSVATWRDYACTLDLRSLEAPQAPGYRLWIETQVEGIDGTSEMDLGGLLDVREASGCDDCADVTLSVRSQSDSPTLRQELGTSGLVDARLVLQAQNRDSGLAIESASLLLAGVTAAGQEVTRTVDLEVVSE